MKIIMMSLAVLLWMVCDMRSQDNISISNFNSGGGTSVSGNDPGSVKMFGGRVDEIQSRANEGLVYDNQGDPAFVDSDRRAKNTAAFGLETTVALVDNGKYVGEEKTIQTGPYTKDGNGNPILQGSFDPSARDEQLSEVVVRYNGPAAFATEFSSFRNVFGQTNGPYTFQMFEKEFTVREIRAVSQIVVELAFNQRISILNSYYLQAPDGTFFTLGTTTQAPLIELNNAEQATPSISSSVIIIRSLTNAEMLQRVKTGENLTNPLKSLNQVDSNPVNGLFMSESSLVNLNVNATGGDITDPQPWKLIVITPKYIAGLTQPPDDSPIKIRNDPSLSYFKITFKVKSSSDNATRTNNRF